MVTADWVVMTAVVAGLGVAAIGTLTAGVFNAADDITALATSVEITAVFPSNFAGSAINFFMMGISAYPDDQREAWLDARLEVNAEAPSGYNYDPDLNETRYIDVASGMPIYESNDGQYYSIGGEVISVADYNTSGRISFKSGFDQYWSENQ